MRTCCLVLVPVLALTVLGAYAATKQPPAGDRCSIRLLEVPADPAVDPKMVLPATPFRSNMPVAEVPAPPCPKQDVPLVSRSIDKQLKPSKPPRLFPHRLELVPNPFKKP